MLPKGNRLKTDKDHQFDKNSLKYYSKYFVLFIRRKYGLSPTRFGIIIGKNIEKRAVYRNRAKRIVRECIRRDLHIIKPGFDCKFILRKSIIEISVKDVYPEVFAGLREYNVI